MFTQIGMTGVDTPVLACTACGSVVAHDLQDRHVAFHARLIRLEEANASA